MVDQLFFSDVKEGGILQKNTSEAIKEALLGFTGKRVFIKIGVSRKIRSLDQNKYYWGVVIECCKQGVKELWGENITKEECHQLLKTHCHYHEKISELTDNNIRIPLDTHDLTTTGFMEYIEKCCKFIGEIFGITVPEPNSQGDIMFEGNKLII